MVVVKFGDDVPKGEFEVADNTGKSLAGVYRHPRLADHWMAVVAPKDWRSSGLKRFKTQAGAARYVMRHLQPEAA